MGTKTIGIKDDTYDRLKGRKREDESFTDLVERLLDETTADWRARFGTLDEDVADALEETVQESRDRTSAGLAARQRTAIEELADANESEDSDETA